MLQRPIGLAFLLALSLTPLGPSLEAAPQTQREQVMTARFDTQPGGALVVEVPDADITLRQGTDDSVQVDVWLRARDMERARERFERMHYQANGTDNGVTVTADALHGNWWDWRNWGGISITVEITLPQRYDIDLKTSDGDITVPSMSGGIRLRSSDGDIAAETLTGDVQAQTSDGDIDIQRIAAAGAVEIRTSDGDIHVDDITAASVVLRTSDGDIASARTRADEIDTHTSDGDIALDAVAGALQAQTNDGSIRVGFEQLGPSSLRTSDGDITIEAPESLGATIDFKGGHLQIGSPASFDGTLNRRDARGQLNGGGPTLQARTSDGTIVLRLRDSG